MIYLSLPQVGAATAIGEQPIKALLNPEAGARLSVAEAITNLVFAPVTSLSSALVTVRAAGILQRGTFVCLHHRLDKRW